MDQYYLGQYPLVQVVIVDKTSNNIGRLLMKNLENSAIATSDQKLLIPSAIGPMEVILGGWNEACRFYVTRIYCVLQENSKIDFSAIHTGIFTT